MRRCPISSGAVVPCFSAVARNGHRKLPHHIAIECHFVCEAEAVEDREYQQWVFRRLAKCFSLFNQQACSLSGRFGFRRGKSFDVHEWGYGLRPEA